jgi:hypothetical protein
MYVKQIIIKIKSAETLPPQEGCLLKATANRHTTEPLFGCSAVQAVYRLCILLYGCLGQPYRLYKDHHHS